MVGILGKKLGMTSLYDHRGYAMACTVVQSGPCIITQLKNTATDGYTAVQVGYDEKKEKNTTKPLLGHFKKAHTTPKKYVVELRSTRVQGLQVGQVIRIEDVFSEGDYLDVTGFAKGKGFQGVVKRHGFSGVGEQTHGQHNRERAPGSLGGSSFPSRVFKGLRMAGRAGGHRVKVMNLQVVKLIPTENLIIVRGAIPGAANSYIILQK